MKLKNLASSALCVLMIAAFSIAIACNTSNGGADASAPPAPSAEHKPLGVIVNNTFQVGVTLAEIPFVSWAKTAADSTPDAATAETTISVVGPGPTAIPLGAAYFNPAATLTASDSLPATINVYKRNAFATDGGGGSTATLIASQSTATVADGGSGSWYSYTPVALNVVAGAYVSPGDSITVTITKVGAGTTVPQGQLSLFTSIQ